MMVIILIGMDILFNGNNELSCINELNLVFIFFFLEIWYDLIIIFLIILYI